MKKGIVQIIPLLAIAALVGVSSVGVIGVARSKTVGASNVLASSSSQGNENSKSNKSENSAKNNKNTNSQSTNIYTEQGKKIETPALEKSNNGVGGTNKQESKKSDPLKVEVVEGVENDLKNSFEATQEATPAVRPGRKIRSNFPITVNPITNEKTVTTPGGVKTIILPEVAIQNMIKAGFPVVLPPVEEDPEGTPSASPEATPSGATESSDILVDSESEIELIEEDGLLIYEIPAVKDEQFLGILDVKIKVKGVVSAENGEILKIKKTFFDNILDFFSF